MGAVLGTCDKDGDCDGAGVLKVELVILRDSRMDLTKGNLWVLHLELTTADHLEIAKECLTEMLLGSCSDLSLLEFR